MIRVRCLTALLSVSLPAVLSAQDVPLQEFLVPGEEFVSTSLEQLPLLMEPTLDHEIIDELSGQTPQSEVITERYPNRRARIQRQVKLDESRNYVNHGSWTWWNPQGQVIGQGEYIDGRRHGKWMRMFAALGGVDPQFQAPFMSEAEFQEGELHGPCSLIDARSQVVASWHFERGKLHGTVSGFYPGGQIKSQMPFENDLPHGEAAYFKSDGSVLKREYFRQGKQLVPITRRFDNQQKEAEGWVLRNASFDTQVSWWDGRIEVRRGQPAGEDLKVGKWTQWYPNGGVRYSGWFADGRPTGRHTWWYENGQRRQAGEFHDGELEGRWTEWHANGMKRAEGEYVAGGKRGTWTVWDEAGQVADSHEYAESDRHAVAPHPDPLKLH